MQKNFILVALIFLAKLNFAQKSELGIKIGIANTNVATNAFFTTIAPLYKLQYGFTYAYHVGNRYQIGLDLIYGSRGFTRQTMVNNNSLMLEDTNFYSQKIRYSYFNMPFFMGFQSKKRLHYSIKTGYCISLLTNAKAYQPIANQKGYYLKDTLLIMTNNVKKFDQSWLVELGLGYNVSSKFGINLSLRNNRSFTSHPQRDYYTLLGVENREWFRVKHNVATLFIDFKFYL